SSACAKTSTVKPSNARTSRCSRALLPLLAVLLCVAGSAQPQGILIDRIVAVVGNGAVLHSELAVRTEQAKGSGAPAEGLECGELEDLLYEKLLVEQAHLDSVLVDEAQVNTELDRRIEYFARQIGGRQKLEEFYGKSTAEIKADFRQQVEEQLLVQTMQQRITADIRTTPRDVQRFFHGIPKDSVPLINAEVEYAQVLRVPKA